MIIRVWHGWTTAGNADAYEALLREEITTESVNGDPAPGLIGIDVLRRNPASTDDGDEVEFMTVMTFESLDAVRAFAGPDLNAAVVPDADRALLSRFDATSQHYELLARNGAWNA